MPLNWVPTYSSYSGPVRVISLSVKTPNYGFVQMGCPDPIWYSDTFYTSGGLDGAYNGYWAMPVPGNVGQQAAPHDRRLAANVLFQDRHVTTIRYQPHNYYGASAAVLYGWILGQP